MIRKTPCSGIPIIHGSVVVDLPHPLAGPTLGPASPFGQYLHATMCNTFCHRHKGGANCPPIFRLLS